MAVKTISITIDEDVLQKAAEIVKGRPDIANRSHLITVALLREHKRFENSAKTIRAKK